ncbi:MAG: hypothetical protein DWQ53_02110 [Microcystis flos-aquae DF17]|nr:MAG: hypothetical protein DWQ53_02110 [Microcystis flos-aquae DF17]
MWGVGCGVWGVGRINKIISYSGKRLSEIQTKLCLAWFIARDTVPHTTAHRYISYLLSPISYLLTTDDHRPPTA